MRFIFRYVFICQVASNGQGLAVNGHVQIIKNVVYKFYYAQ